MTSRDFLNQLKYIDTEIKAKMEELQELRERLGIAGINYEDKIKCFSVHDGMALKVASVMDLEKSYIQKIDDLSRMKNIASELVYKIENREFQLILDLRYLRFWKFERIAESMNYSYQWVHHLHKKALKDFDLVWMEEKEKGLL